MSSELRRELGLWDAVGVGLGAIVGAGLFVVTGQAAGVAGPAFLLGLLLAGVAAACNALSSAQLAATYPQAGGTYEYGYRLLNPTAGFAAGWMFLASKLAAAGTVALTFAGYLGQLVPGLPQRPVAVAAAVALTAANLLGIKKAGRLNTAVVAVTLATLAYFVLAGAPAFRPGNLQPFAPNGVAAVLQSAALLFFAYTGYARLATLGEEVAEPRKTIPRAIVIALVIATVVYGVVALVAVGAVGAGAMGEAARAENSPLFAAAATFRAPGAAAVIGVGAVTATLGVLLSQVLGISRMMLAMSRRGDLPSGLSAVGARSGAPDRAVVLTGLFIVAVALFGTIRWVVSAATFTILIYYGIANWAALKMRREDKLFPDAVAWLGLAVCLLLALSLVWTTPDVAASGITLLAIGFALRALFRRVTAG